MKSFQASVAVTLIFVGTSLPASGGGPCGAGGYCPLPADLTSSVLFQGRLELELRRAGGPRSDLVAGLLKTSLAVDDPAWGRLVITACREGVVSCRDYVDLAVSRATKEQGGNTDARRAELTLIRKEVELQALSARDRQAFYRNAINTGGATIGVITVTDVEAAMRALEEGDNSLLPSIRSRLETWASGDRMAIRPYLDVAEAIASPSASDGLIQLVRQGATYDVTSLKGEKPRSGEDAVAYDNERRTARLALVRLRRMNPPRVLEDLRNILALYDSVKEQRRRTEEKLQAAGRPYLSSEVAAPGDALGRLGKDISEAVGDFGDRALERSALGGPTLWDRVSEAEKALEKRGQLTLGAMVSSSAQ